MQNLIVIENELVPVYQTSTGEKVVYGTELYASIGSKRQYTDWIKGRLEDCDAVEDEDYKSFSQKNEKPHGGRPITEYIIKLDIAKEMAMLERNEKGKQVRRYFIWVDKKYKESKASPEIEQVAHIVKFIADDLKVNEASKLLMYENFCKDYGIPTGFLPKYENNGSREMRPATELLKKFGTGLSVIQFNKLMLQAGYLEEKERKSTSSKTGIKKYKALSEKGLKYGENLVNPKNQKEVQPYYYSDTFLELYENVSGRLKAS